MRLITPRGIRVWVLECPPKPCARCVGAGCTERRRCTSSMGAPRGGIEEQKRMGWVGLGVSLREM